MPDITGAWSAAQLGTFLEGSTIPMRIGCHHSSGGLWMVSLWYRWEDEAFHCATGRDATLTQFLEANDAVSFEVSTNRTPYLGVRGNGTAHVQPDEDKELLRGLIDRYLGSTESDLAQMLLATDREEVHIRIEPDRLYTWDFSERMDGIHEEENVTPPEA
jgi:hypothetical protein